MASVASSVVFPPLSGFYKQEGLKHRGCSCVYTHQRDIILLQSAKSFVNFWRCGAETLGGSKFQEFPTSNMDRKAS